MTTSPDLTPYVDLRPYDRDLADLIDRAILDAATKMPGWVPREGNTEVVVIEALALIAQEMVYAINRLPAAVTMALLGLFDVTRSPGAYPVATATFTVVDAAGYTIPAGTILRLDVGGEVGSLTFVTDVDLVIAPAATTGTVAITGLTYTEDANGTAAATALDLITSLFYVNTVVLATAVADGANPEDDAAWLERGIVRLSRLTTTLVLPAHFTAAALEEVDVTRATTLDLYDGVGANTSTDYGHVTVAVLGAGGALLSGGRKTAIEAVLEDLALVNIDVHVIDPTLTAVPVTATVVRLAGYDSSTVEDSVEAALTAYLDPEAWPWAATVRRNELIALIDGVEGVDYVVTLAAPAADVTLTGAANLVTVGALTITVNAPA